MARAIILVLILANAMTAQAGERWVAVSGGRATFRLANVTDASTTYRGYSIERGSMNSGVVYGAMIGYDFDRPWSVGVSYYRSSLSTRGISGDYLLDVDFPLHAFQFLLFRNIFESNSHRLSAGTFLGLGRVTAVASTSGGAFGGMTGKTSDVEFLVEGRVMYEYKVAENLSVSLGGGFRRLRFDEVFIGARPLTRDDNGEIVEFDFSGWNLLLGLKLLLPSGGANPR